MQINELENHDHASGSLKAILLVFVLILTGVLAYLVYMQNNTEPSYESDTAKKASTQNIVADEATLVACGDTEKYGFELGFDEVIWKDYQVKVVLQKNMDPQPGYAVVTCYFEMPTTDKDSEWVKADSTHTAGHASLFAVSVYTPAQWTMSQEEANKPTELGHNANYYWGWSQSQSIPDDLTAPYADAKNVVKTFKIAP